MVLSTQELIKQIESLPVEGRAQIIDSLLRTMNQPDPSMDTAWAQEAQRRLGELLSGAVQGIAAQDVFTKARERFSK